MLWRVTCDLQCHVKYLDRSTIWCHNQLTASCYCTHTHTRTHSPGSLPQSTIFPPWWLLSPPPPPLQPLLKPLPDLPRHPATNACPHLCGPELQQTHRGAQQGPYCSAEPGECRLEGESPQTWGEGTASVNGQSESDYRRPRGTVTTFAAFFDGNNLIPIQPMYLLWMCFENGVTLWSWDLNLGVMQIDVSGIN